MRTRAEEIADQVGDYLGDGLYVVNGGLAHCLQQEGAEIIKATLRDEKPTELCGFVYVWRRKDTTGRIANDTVIQRIAKGQ